MQAVLGCQKGGGSLSRRSMCRQSKLRLFALREQRNIQNTEFGEER